MTQVGTCEAGRVGGWKEDVRVCGGRLQVCYLEVVVSLSPSSWKSVVAGEDGRKRGELERECVRVYDCTSSCEHCYLPFTCGYSESSSGCGEVRGGEGILGLGE